MPSGARSPAVKMIVGSRMTVTGIFSWLAPRQGARWSDLCRAGWGNELFFPRTGKQEVAFLVGRDRRTDDRTEGFQPLSKDADRARGAKVLPLGGSYYADVPGSTGVADSGRAQRGSTV